MLHTLQNPGSSSRSPAPGKSPAGRQGSVLLRRPRTSAPATAGGRPPATFAPVLMEHATPARPCIRAFQATIRHSPSPAARARGSAPRKFCTDFGPTGHLALPTCHTTRLDLQSLAHPRLVSQVCPSISASAHPASTWQGPEGPSLSPAPATAPQLHKETCCICGGNPESPRFSPQRHAAKR